MCVISEFLSHLSFTFYIRKNYVTMIVKIEFPNQIKTKFSSHNLFCRLHITVVTKIEYIYQNKTKV
jgi:hypothetical protein